MTDGDAFVAVDGLFNATWVKLAQERGVQLLPPRWVEEESEVEDSRIGRYPLSGTDVGFANEFVVRLGAAGSPVGAAIEHIAYVDSPPAIVVRFRPR